MFLKAAAVADFGNWRAGIAQQRSRLIQPDQGEILFEIMPADLFEQARKPRIAHTAMIRDLAQGQRLVEVLINKIDPFLDHRLFAQ
jgi:hypothetical protein